MKIIINHEFIVDTNNLNIDVYEFKTLLQLYSVFFQSTEEVITILPQKITLDDDTCLSFLKTGLFHFEQFVAYTTPEHTLCLEILK